ncbi:hypothetical protein AU193_13355 [Mycobacterium sp. GA-1285]|nr:hypothetical protein AU193_13355 [Mycobacterium sp. GA-1285]
MLLALLTVDFFEAEKRPVHFEAVRSRTSQFLSEVRKSTKAGRLVRPEPEAMSAYDLAAVWKVTVECRATQPNLRLGQSS